MIVSFDLVPVDLLCVNFGEEDLVLLVRLGLLLLGAELFDVGVAGLEVELHVAGLALLLAEGELEGGELGGEVVDPSLEEPDAPGGGVVCLLRGTEILIGTEKLDQSEIGRTHSLFLFRPGAKKVSRATHYGKTAWEGKAYGRFPLDSRGLAGGWCR